LPGPAARLIGQLGIGEAEVSGLQGEGLRRPGRLLRDQAMQQRLSRGHGRTAAPGLKLERLLLLRDQRQGPDVALRLRGGGGQQGVKLRGEAGHGRRVEEVGVVAEEAGDPLRTLAQPELQVEVRLPGGARQVAQAHPAAQLHPGGREVLQHEEGLEERRARRIARDHQGLQELLERDVGVRVRPQGRLADTAEQRGERRIVRQAGAHHQGVDEEADQPFELAARPVAAVGAHHHLVLAAPAGEQGLVGGQEHHVQGRSGPPRQLSEAAGERRRDGKRRRAAAVAAHRRARPVGGEREVRRRSGELLPPVAHLPFEDFAAQPPALPDGEVGVLDRQGW